jgi:hypothetical protein
MVGAPGRETHRDELDIDIERGLRDERYSARTSHTKQAPRSEENASAPRTGDARQG